MEASVKTYDEETKVEVSDPDLTKGRVYLGKRLIGYTEETKVPMNGTVSPRNPMGLYKRVPSQPIYEDCQWYRRYTEEELAAMNEKTVDEKISDAVTAAVALAQGGAL